MEKIEETSLPPAVDLQDVGKRFGRQWVLAHLNLRIRRGESIALFGENGSGKSTLLKMIASLIAPSAGNLLVLGHNSLEDRIEIRKKVRLLAHEKQIYGSLTVTENLKLAAGLRGLSSEESEETIPKLLDLFRIKRFQDRRVAHLSEGMKKRVVLARLLVGREEPELLLLDEPHPTLDDEGREILTHLIQGWRKAGKTILLASHDHEEALAQADRSLVIEEGGIRSA